MADLKEQGAEADRKGRKDLFRAFFLCAAVVMFVRFFVVEPFKIPSSSMVPTLQIGDHIFVSKFNFGMSLPFAKKTLMSWASPKVGDVIVFLFPKDESLHYVKRVVAVAGDKVRFSDLKLWVNDKEIPMTELSQAETANIMQGADSKGVLFEEELGGKKHLVQFSMGKAPTLTRIPVEEVVPEGHVFVVGDNRDDSYDSRNWGPVPLSHIRGKAQLIWLSLDDKRGWNELLKVRWNRCGKRVR